MDEILLKSVDIALKKDQLPHPLSPQSNTLSGIEIWSSRSKIVNEHLSSMKPTLKLVGVVDPLFMPLWSIVDKPYNVYTLNRTTQEVFESLLNHSDTDGGVSRSSLLTKLSTEGVYMLFYTEIQGVTPSVKCIVLELNVSKLVSIIGRDKSDQSVSKFIDEQEKEELMDTLMKQRVAVFNNLSAKRQAEASMQEKQMKMKQTRQLFRKIITKEVKTHMEGKSKPEQVEVAEICYKAMSYKFKQMVEMTDNDHDEILKWLKVLLDLVL